MLQPYLFSRIHLNSSRQCFEVSENWFEFANGQLFLLPFFPHFFGFSPPFSILAMQPHIHLNGCKMTFGSFEKRVQSCND